MDPITAKLTESALTGMGNLSTPATTPSTYQTDQTSSFARVLDNQMDANQSSNAKLLEFVENMSRDMDSQPMKAIPADGVQVDVAKATEVDRLAVDKPTNIFDIFKDVNSSALSMDQVMEKLTMNTKFTPQDMIRVQVLASTNTIAFEAMSKLAESAHRAISTPFNMNIA